MVGGKNGEGNAGGILDTVRGVRKSARYVGWMQKERAIIGGVWGGVGVVVFCVGVGWWGGWGGGGGVWCGYVRGGGWVVLKFEKDEQSHIAGVRRA